MKILVISDTHGDLTNAKLAINHTLKIGLNIVIHCGDHIKDAEELEQEYPDLDFYYVPGNCDGWFFRATDKTKIITIEDKKILFTHGDHHNIKYDYDKLFIDIQAQGANMGFCGHSHIAYIEKRSGITMVNPGSITLPRDINYPSYAVLDLVRGKPIKINMLMIKDGIPTPHVLW